MLGPETFESRWSRGALAMTHLIVVDFMLQTMCGSLLQFVAVVAGANIWRPRLVAAIVHPLITAGAVLLASAFLFGRPVLFLLAACVFVAALGFFLTVMAIGIAAHAGTRHEHPRPASRRAGTAGRPWCWARRLQSTLGLGLNLNPGLTLPALINVHVAWGLGGWALMLVIGVSYMVVPMFQLTPGYPVWFTRALPAGLFLVLCVWTLQLIPGMGAEQPWQAGAGLVGVALAGSYAAVTLWLQSRRRRRQTDATFVLARSDALALRIRRVLDRVRGACRN